MKTNHIAVYAAVVACAFGLPLVAVAQTTVFSDNFTTDTSLASPPWYNMNNTANAAATDRVHFSGSVHELVLGHG